MTNPKPDIDSPTFLSRTFLNMWIQARYRIPGLDECPYLGEDDDAPPPSTAMLCRRCGAEVNYLTKHAVERHGDTDVQVLPAVNDEPEGGWKW